MNMSGKALRINLIVPLAEKVIVVLTGGMVSCGVNIFTEVCMIVLVVAVIALEDVGPVSYAIDAWAGVIIDVLAGTVIGIATGISVDVSAGVDANIWAATKTALEFIPMLATSEEALLFGWEASSCCPTAVWDCRALQARIPSYHV